MNVGAFKRFLGALGILPRPAANGALATAGAGTLTGALLVNGIVTRTGPVAAFTDTTDTAALITAAMPYPPTIGQSWEVTIKNTTAFAETVAGGTNVTMSGLTIVPPNSVGRFLLTYTASNTFTMLGIGTSVLSKQPNQTVTAISTAGAGTLTAAGLVGGVINRTGPTAAYTDTTDTAAAIILALPNANVGDSFYVTIINTVNFVNTLAANTGVTLAGQAQLIEPLSWAQYLVTVTALTTVTMTGIAQGELNPLPAAKYSTAALSTTTAAAGQLTGAKYTVMNNSGANPGNYTTRTGAQMIADIPNVQVGQTWVIRLKNGQGTGTLTLVAGDGNVTITGTATAAINTWRDFLATVATATTITLQSIGTGTDS